MKIKISGVYHRLSRQKRHGLKVLPAIAVFTACLLLSAPGITQQTPDGFGFKIFRSDSVLYPYVQVYFRTYNESFDPLPNVTAQNIGLLVKGRTLDPREHPYIVESVRGRDDVIRTVLVIDSSKTMQGAPFDAAVEAAARYIDFKRPQDQIGIVALNDSAPGYEIISDFERNREFLARRLVDLKPDGNTTRLYDGLATAMQMSLIAGQGGTQSEDAGNISSTSIIVFSDGKDEGSALTRSDLMLRISQAETPVPIYSLAYTQDDPSHLLNLQALSRNSVGKYYDLRQSLGDMTRAVEDVHNITQGDYVVTFISELPIDGERHSMKVGLEWPSQSGRIRLEDAQFEAISLISFPRVQEECRKLAGRFARLIREDDNQRFMAFCTQPE